MARAARNRALLDHLANPGADRSGDVEDSLKNEFLSHRFQNTLDTSIFGFLCIVCVLGG